MNRITRFVAIGVVVFGLYGCGGGGSDDDDDEGGPLTMTDGILLLGLTNKPYEDIINPTGGVEPYSYTIQTTNLPDGVAAQGAPGNVLVSGTPIREDVYVFSVTVTDANGSSVTGSFSIVIVDDLDLSGMWNFNIDVTVTTGVCAGEENLPPSNDTITITRNTTGPNVDTYTFDGFLGIPGNQLTGQIDKNNIKDGITVSGMYPEDFGTTTSSHNLKIYATDSMVGVEEWSWTDGLFLCPFGLASVTADK